MITAPALWLKSCFCNTMTWFHSQWLYLTHYSSLTPFYLLKYHHSAPLPMLLNAVYKVSSVYVYYHHKQLLLLEGLSSRRTCKPKSIRKAGVLKFGRIFVSFFGSTDTIGTHVIHSVSSLIPLSHIVTYPGSRADFIGMNGVPPPTMCPLIKRP